MGGEFIQVVMKFLSAQFSWIYFDIYKYFESNFIHSKKF